MASPFPSLPFRSASESSDSLPLPENSKTTQNPGPTRGLCPINEQENRRPSNPYADPQVESSNDMTKVARFSKPVVTVRLHRPPLHAPTIETQEETKSKLSHSLFRMPHPAFWKWPQGDAHPLKLVYHTLVFQAFIGFVVVVLVIHALRNPGWWTQRETAIGLASEFHVPTAAKCISRQHLHKRPTLPRWSYFVSKGCHPSLTYMAKTSHRGHSNHICCPPHPSCNWLRDASGHDLCATYQNQCWYALSFTVDGTLWSSWRKHGQKSRQRFQKSLRQATIWGMVECDNSHFCSIVCLPLLDFYSRHSASC